MIGSLFLLLVLLACPLLMWLVMRRGHSHGHAGHSGHHGAAPDGPYDDAVATDDLRRRRAELDREITARERVEAQ